MDNTVTVTVDVIIFSDQLRFNMVGFCLLGFPFLNDLLHFILAADLDGLVFEKNNYTKII